MTFTVKKKDNEMRGGRVKENLEKIVNWYRERERIRKKTMWKKNSRLKVKKRLAKEVLSK